MPVRQYKCLIFTINMYIRTYSVSYELSAVFIIIKLSAHICKIVFISNAQDTFMYLPAEVTAGRI